MKKALEAELTLHDLIGEIEHEIYLATGMACNIQLNELDYDIDEDDLEGIPEDVGVFEPSTWKAGDVVECILSESSLFEEGEEYVVHAVNPTNVVTLIRDNGERVIAYDTKFKFKYRLDE